MKAWTRFWQQMTSRSVRQAWGLATDGKAWSLVGLSLVRAEGVRIHTIQRIVTADANESLGEFGQGLAQLGALAAPGVQRLNVALGADDMVTGLLELPAQMPPENWAAEVQMEVSQLLGVQPDEVSFDFQPDPLTEGLLSRVHWVGCQHSHIQNLKNQTRMAGWQLHSVEPAWHAAHRAARHLQGGLASLLTQPAQDWRFDLAQQANDQPDMLSVLTEFEPGLALRQAMQSAAGPRLVASGLALKAWL